MREIKFDHIYHHKEDGDYQHEEFTLLDIENNRAIDHQECMRTDGYRLVARRSTTGLQDKNGEDLYRLDLWEYHNVIYIVSWHPDEARFYFRHPNAFAGDDDHIDLGWSTHGVKVGNIYEHPHLLKGVDTE